MGQALILIYENSKYHLKGVNKLFEHCLIKNNMDNQVKLLIFSVSAADHNITEVGGASDLFC